MKPLKNISAKIIAQEAIKMGYTVDILSEEYDIFLVNNGKIKILFKNIDCGLNNSVAYKFAGEKKLTYFMLEREHIKVPHSVVISENTSFPEILEILKINQLSFPLVVKPAVGMHGDGVGVHITDDKVLENAIMNARKHYKEVIIQEFFKGEDFRIMVVGHKVVAVMKRIPAHIFGDGISTIKDLIARENDNIIRGKEHDAILTHITIDSDVEMYLQSQGLTLESIPLVGQQIFVRKNANLSTGGIAIDMTDDLHPEIKKMCEKATKILGLQVCGIDFLSTDISKPLAEQIGGIIEINATPGLRGHHFPFQGQPRNVAKAILDLAFQKGARK